MSQTSAQSTVDREFVWRETVTNQKCARRFSCHLRAIRSQSRLAHLKNYPVSSMADDSDERGEVKRAAARFSFADRSSDPPLEVRFENDLCSRTKDRGALPYFIF